MKQILPFSFRWVMLGIALLILIGCSLLSNPFIDITNKYFCTAIGGLILMTAFASFGHYNYRGVPSKLPYRIVRYMLAVLLLVSAVIQISERNEMYYSPYSTVVLGALIAYLLMYKPSNSSTSEKALKIAGYTLILMGVNGLQTTQNVVEYMVYIANETNWSVIWGAISATFICIIIGIVLLLFYKKKS